MSLLLPLSNVALAPLITSALVSARLLLAPRASVPSLTVVVPV